MLFRLVLLSVGLHSHKFLYFSIIYIRGKNCNDVLWDTSSLKSLTFLLKRRKSLVFHIRISPTFITLYGLKWRIVLKADAKVFKTFLWKKKKYKMRRCNAWSWPPKTPTNIPYPSFYHYEYIKYKTMNLWICRRSHIRWSLFIKLLILFLYFIVFYIFFRIKVTVLKRGKFEVKQHVKIFFSFDPRKVDSILQHVIQ